MLNNMTQTENLSASNTPESNCKGKYFIKSIDPATKEWIRSKPHFARMNKITGNYNITKIQAYYFNYLFSDLIKKAPGGNNEDILNDTLYHFKTKDFYRLYMDRFVMNKPTWDVEGIACPDVIFDDSFIIEDKNSNEINVKFVMYEEKYIKKGNVYSKTIGVFMN